MAFQAGKAGYIGIDNTGGTLKDLSTFCTNVEGFPGTVASLETTAYGKNSKTYIPGLRDSKITCTFIWDPTATTGPDSVLASRITTPVVATVTHGPMGSTTSNVKYSVEAVLEEWKVSTPVGGLVTGVATFQGSDDVSVGVF